MPRDDAALFERLLTETGISSTYAKSASDRRVGMTDEAAEALAMAY